MSPACDTIVIKAPVGTKARWVRQSQREGRKLSDWILERVENKQEHHMYILRDGTEVTIEQIRQAFSEGKARLVHGRAENHTSTSLMLDGQDFDTQGECESMWEESWTAIPKSVNACAKAARC